MDLSLLANHLGQYTTIHRFVRFPLTSRIHDCTYMFSPNEVAPEIVTDVTAGDAYTPMWRG